MKTRLLKKVRKRYRIVKGPVAGHYLLDLKSKDIVKIPNDWSVSDFYLCKKKMYELTLGAYKYKQLKEKKEKRLYTRQRRQRFNELIQ